MLRRSIGRIPICTFQLFVAAIVAASTCPAATRPNILFILTEDQGAHLGFLGTPGLVTPNMDSLARSGVYFRNFFVAYPVCSASKASIYTGLASHVNGIVNNTRNYFKAASALTEAESHNPLYLSNRVRADTPTLVERLRAAGYYEGVTSKLHVAPVEKFPYDEFYLHEDGPAVAKFIRDAKQAGKAWFLFFNIGASHRPFIKNQRQKLAVDPASVKLPAYLPDTPVVRLDWAEYLTAVEAADHVVGAGLAALRESGEESNTVIICMGGDHGPAYPHGKMTLYDLGLRVTMSINWPGVTRPAVSDALVSELDFVPTIMDFLGLPPMLHTQGVSLRQVLQSPKGATAHPFIFAEISDRGEGLPKGMQERSVFDGRWHLIYRENLSPPWRLVQDDSKFWKVWKNRTYDETVKNKDRFPDQYRILTELDPQGLGGSVKPIELYDLQSDPDEMNSLAGDATYRPELVRLLAALRQWVAETGDKGVHPPVSPPS